MKNIIKYSLLLVVLFSLKMHAIERDTLFQIKLPERLFDFDDCDACGCSASGGGMGSNSILNDNFVGIRYLNQHYKSREGIFNNSPWVEENFNTIQVWSRIPITKTIQISSIIPYHFHNRERSTGNEKISGLGDISLLGIITVWQTKKDSTLYKHKLQLVGGAKLPTGKYSSANNGSVNPSFQVGTGSYDFISGTEYTIQRSKWGLNTILNYTFKTENSQKYQFGNQFNYGSTLFYTAELDKGILIPQLGLAGELYEKNKAFGENLVNTSGSILFGKAGVEYGISDFSIGLTGMIPVSQNLTNNMVDAKYRWSVNLNYAL